MYTQSISFMKNLFPFVVYRIGSGTMQQLQLSSSHLSRFCVWISFSSFANSFLFGSNSKQFYNNFTFSNCSQSNLHFRVNCKVQNVYFQSFRVSIYFEFTPTNVYIIYPRVHPPDYSGKSRPLVERRGPGRPSPGRPSLLRSSPERQSGFTNSNPRYLS